jgi:hypothetical protein
MGIVAALTLGGQPSPALAQDWTPTFRSDEAVVVVPEPKRKPIAAKRRSVRPKQQASIRLPTSSTPSRSVHKLAIQVAENNSQLMTLRSTMPATSLNITNRKAKRWPSRS